MNKRLIVIALIVIAAALAVLVWRLHAGDPEHGSPSVRRTVRPDPAPAPKLPPGMHPPADTPGPEHAGPEFDTRRASARAKFQQDMTERLQTCLGPGQPAPGAMRDVRFVFEWQPERSSQELQFFTVREVEIIDKSAIAAKARDCIEHSLGMPLVVQLPPDQLPKDARQFVEILPLFVPS